MAFVTFYIVQSVFPELEDKAEVVKKICFRHCLEGIGGNVAEFWAIFICGFSYRIHKFIPCRKLSSFIMT